ncbi:MAG: permease [Alphaproteobacteria bacterium]|nr:permease [Alphaproteobacteria bacterium]
MQLIKTFITRAHRVSFRVIAVVLSFISLAVLPVEFVMGAGQFVIGNLISVAPVVAVGLLVAAWVVATGAGSVAADAFQGRAFQAILIASAIGAVTPVCGITVLPLMSGLLVAGVPLAPVMAFWLSSPITDPAMLAATVAMLGLPMALGKTIVAFAMGVFGGAITHRLATRRWVMEPLRRRAALPGDQNTGSCAAAGFRAAFWRDPSRRRRFVVEIVSTGRLVLICLSFAFVAEYALKDLLPPNAMAAYVGGDTPWAIPLAVFVGSPIYLDGYAALPLVRGMIDLGMSQGAAMAFLVSGGVVSIWGAIAIFPVIQFKPFLLYLTIAVLGSLMAGYGYGFVVS